jgi:anti-sigma-K factor RskA
MTHDAAAADLSAYLLGVLDPDEVQSIADHLEDCPICAREIETLQPVIGMLGTLAPEATPPPELRARVLAQLSPAAPASDPTPRPLVTPLRQRLPNWARFSLVAAAGLVLLLTATAMLIYRELESTKGDLNATVALLTKEREIFANPARTIPLIADNAPNAYGTLYVGAGERRALLVVDSLPPTPTDRVYQIWLVGGNGRDNGGVFTVGQSGDADVLIDAPNSFANYQAMGITTEPAPRGSDGPTSPRVIGCPLN